MQIKKIDEHYFKIGNSFYSLSNSNDIDSLLCMFELTENGYPNHKRYNELVEILNEKIKSEDEIDTIIPLCKLLKENGFHIMMYTWRKLKYYLNDTKELLVQQQSYLCYL